MSTRYGKQGGSNVGNSEASAEVTGAVRRGPSEHGAGGPDFGRARTDYGSRAYGGSLDESGLEAGGSSSASPRGGYAGRLSGGRSSRRGRWSGNGMALLLGGLGLGGTLAYVLGSRKGNRGR